MIHISIPNALPGSFKLLHGVNSNWQEFVKKVKSSDRSNYDLDSFKELLESLSNKLDDVYAAVSMVEANEFDNFDSYDEDDM